MVPIIYSSQYERKTKGVWRTRTCAVVTPLSRIFLREIDTYDIKQACHRSFSVCWQYVFWTRAKATAKSIAEMTQAAVGHFGNTTCPITERLAQVDPSRAEDECHKLQLVCQVPLLFLQPSWKITHHETSRALFFQRIFQSDSCQDNCFGYGWGLLSTTWPWTYQLLFLTWHVRGKRFLCWA